LKQSLIQTIMLIRSDMQFRCDYEHKKLTPLRVLGFLLNQAILSQIIFRFQGFFYTHHLAFLASLIRTISSVIFTVSIDSSTKIGPGFLLLHASYVNIGKNVTIGKNCIFAHQNSIGPAYVLEQDEAASDVGPVIGDHVFFGVGCAVFGNISIGSFSTIGVNSAVDQSFPERSVLIGVPAKNRAML